MAKYRICEYGLSGDILNFNQLLINPLHYPWCKESITTPNADKKNFLPVWNIGA